MRNFLRVCFAGLLIIFFISCSKDGALTGAGPSPAFAGESSSGGSVPDGSGSSGTGNSGNQGGLITAGEWNDLDHWDFWKTILQRDTIRDQPALWGFYTTNRFTILIKDAAGKLLPDVKITCTANGDISTARTDNSGKAELFPGLNIAGVPFRDCSLTADYQGKTFELGIFDAEQSGITKSIPVSKTRSDIIDISFVVDATGSMGDEINYLKDELADVIDRAGNQLPGTQIRMGSVFYRDMGDEYVTKEFAFTTDAGSLGNFLNDQQANGGGDYPEAADQGLEKAIGQLQWSDKAVNRLLFLILDAPPHDGQEQLSRLQKVVKEAQQKGIRIIPVSASGIDRSTEFFLRFLSVSTNSTYVFITNDSGIGNPHLIATVGDYTVEYLNDLMVRLITKYGQDHD